MVDWRPGHRVSSIQITTDGHGNVRHYIVDDEPFDGVVLAVPADAAVPLLATLPALAPRLPAVPTNTPNKDKLLRTLASFDYLPIATITLTLASAWRLPEPMLMLFEDKSRGHVGQWLFDRAALSGLHKVGELAIVISAADKLPEREQVMRSVEQQVREQASRASQAAMPAVINRTMITEKRATFAATPHMQRPGAKTPWPRLVLAGDWTDTGYPGVLEGAVRSGLTATT